jgi:hypothetical protein
VCNDLYFGDLCEHHDVFAPHDHSPTGDYLCFVEAVDVGVSIPGKLYLECSGHGMCHVPPPGTTITEDTMGCTCASTAYSGAQCQHAQCPDCGPYGKCVQLGPDESPTGEYETMCVCAVHADSFTTPLAAKPIGTENDGPCVVDLCLDVSQGRYGTLLLDGSSLTGGGDAPPTGRCVCTIAGNGLRNEGIFCDEPVCERDEDGDECGINLVSVKNKVCRSCADYPYVLECAGSVLPVGAVCDCDNAAGDATPYWLSTAFIDRYTHDGARGASAHPICTLYCLHGSWSEEQDVHACRGCFSDGYVGDRCEAAICVHGQYDPAVSSLCVPNSCEPGWAGARCNKCDPAFGLDNTLGDDNPGCDVCTAGWAHPAGLEVGDIAALPANATCIPCAGIVHCHAEGTATQVCAHDHAPVKFSCVCRAQWAGDKCASCSPNHARATEGAPCRPESELVPCGVGATGSVVVLAVDLDGTSDAQVVDGHASHCICLPNFDSATACAACLPTFALALALAGGPACIPCHEALQCRVQGTESVACPVPGSVPGSCNCFPGYAGATCDTCTEGATWDTDAETCTACALSCGPDGVPNCDADPPTCMCYNGFGGAACDSCIGCGPGGDCVSRAFLASHWCTCRVEDGWHKSVTTDTTGATDTDIRMSPCDSCAAEAMPTGPACVSIVEVCGFGAQLVASHNAAACFCGPAFFPLAQQPSGKCELCAGGGVGPDCEDCEPPCAGQAHCLWRNTTLRVGPVCECNPGFVDSLVGPCSQCDTPTFQGAFCRPCPASCGIGTCAVEPLSQDTYCLCPAGSRHAVALDPRSTCGTCAVGETPLSCRPCPACGPNSVCSEDVRGDPVCNCLPGHARAPGATRFADPCFRADDLTGYLSDPVYLAFLKPVQPVPATDLAAQLAGFSSLKLFFVYAAFPLFTVAMCGCGCLVWSLGRRVMRVRAAARTAKRAAGQTPLVQK